MSIINLLPDDYLRNRARRRANILCLALFVVVMAGVGGAAVVTNRNHRSTLEVCGRVNASYLEAAKLIEQVHRLQDQKAVLVAKAEQASALQERVPRSYVLGTITNACPETAALTSLRLDSKIVEPDKKPGGNPNAKFDAVAAQKSGKPPLLSVDLLVTGQATTDVDVARFITNLARNPLLSNVDLNYSEERTTQDKIVYREFQVKMEIKPGVDVLDVNPPAEKPAPSLARAGGTP
jgi:Tfp pilus assembly protein PilN